MVIRARPGLEPGMLPFGLEGSGGECLVQNCEGVEAVLRCRRRELVDRGVVRVRCEVLDDLRSGCVRIHADTISTDRVPAQVSSYPGGDFFTRSGSSQGGRACIIRGVTTNEQTPADTMNSAIATVLRAEKAAQKLTYPNLAEATGIPAVSLKRYLAGERDITVRVLALIAQALNMTPGEIWAKALERL